MLSQKRLKEVVDYDPETGIFRWKDHLNGDRRVRVGCVAGSRGPKGHLIIRIDGSHYRASRLAFLYMTGSFPPHQVDHRDTNTANNKWSNLRSATNTQNCRNKPLSSRNKSGFKGVSFHKASGKYQASIRHKHRKIYLGVFPTPAEAHDAYRVAATRFFGEFARFS